MALLGLSLWFSLHFLCWKCVFRCIINLKTHLKGKNKTITSLNAHFDFKMCANIRIFSMFMQRTKYKMWRCTCFSPVILFYSNPPPSKTFPSRQIICVNNIVFVLYFSFFLMLSYTNAHTEGCICFIKIGPSYTYTSLHNSFLIQ